MRVIINERGEPRVAYVCDRNECEQCSYPECRHTTDIFHAKNFEQFRCDALTDGPFMEKENDYQKFANEVIEMLMMFSDDDNQISLKKCELEVNMKSILEEFV